LVLNHNWFLDVKKKEWCEIGLGNIVFIKWIIIYIIWINNLGVVLFNFFYYWSKNLENFSPPVLWLSQPTIYPLLIAFKLKSISDSVPSGTHNTDQQANDSNCL